MTVRVNHDSVQRTGWRTPAFAIAANDGVCPGCGEDILEDEPVVLLGSMVEQDEHGNRSVDLTGAEWHCQKCAMGRVR